MAAIDLMLPADQDTVELAMTVTPDPDPIELPADQTTEHLTAADTGEATDAVAVDGAPVELTLDDNADSIDSPKQDLPASDDIVQGDFTDTLAYDFITANTAGGTVAIDNPVVHAPAPAETPGRAVDLPAPPGTPAPELPADEAPHQQSGNSDHEGFDHFFGGDAMMSMMTVKIADPALDEEVLDGLALDEDVTSTDAAKEWISADWIAVIDDSQAEQQGPTPDIFVCGYAGEGAEFATDTPLKPQDDMLM